MSGADPDHQALAAAREALPNPPLSQSHAGSSKAASRQIQSLTKADPALPSRSKSS
ncbi:hypothetical protein PCANC_19256 [Puccinia coronata f. sp. avenae]|uniref:Uncharacterized protein n=1 Tax=Puccinia coronata f. sp. avenae TaxID=200324 RepID=A0A2N5UFH4_9BASI|nr:hypothetical protein PCANC_19256 [Puccinia coronata f. sp. avenae]